MTIYLRSILFGWAIGYSQGSTDKVILYINNQESRDRPDYFFDPVVPTVSKLFFGNTAILKGKSIDFRSKERGRSARLLIFHLRKKEQKQHEKSRAKSPREQMKCLLQWVLFRLKSKKHRL